MKKSLLIISMLALSISSNALASSKICFGSTKSDDTKGLIMLAQIDNQNITLKPLKGETYDGTYPIYNHVVNGKDGKTYLEYKGEYADSREYILVDKDLLQDGTTGLLQIRSRGEGYFNGVYVCRDAQK